MKNKVYAKPLIILGCLVAIGAGAGVSAIASAHSQGQGPGPAQGKMMGMHRGPGVNGTVSSVSGNTITITDRKGTSYTVVADNATISKLSTVSVSDIHVGDSIGVQGTVNGTTVTATHIMDGFFTPPKKLTPTFSQKPP